MTQALQALIDQAWEDRTSLSPKSAPNDIREAVANVISQLDSGALRVAEKQARTGSSTSGSRRLCCCRSVWKTTRR